jgi:Tol biopolymer transport system component
MPRSSEEILGPARTELARGRPRAALKELEQARAELLANADLDGLKELLELARAIKTLAPADTKARERLLAATEEGIESLAPGTVVELAETPSERTPPAEPRVSFTPYGLVSTEQIFAPARAEIERQNTRRALRLLEKARRKLLARADVDGLGELIELAQRLPIAKPRHAARQKRLVDATQQNVRYLGRRNAIKAGETWSDPFATARPKTKLPTLPPMTRREKLIAAAIVVVLAGGITTWALVKRAPQRAVHAIQCPTGQQGSPTWSPDGKQIAFAKNGECGTQIMVMPAAGGPLRTVTSHFGELPDWSPDGHEILYRSKDGFSVVAVPGGERRLIREDDGDMGASWSRDGEWIAFTHGKLPLTDLSGAIYPYKSTLYVMRRDGRKATRIIGHACDPGTPSWRPGSGELSFACSGHFSGIYVYRQSDGKLLRFASVPFDNTAYVPRNVSWSPDGREVAFGRNGVEVASRKTDTSPGDLLPPPIAQVGLPGSATIDVAWSPDGKQIAFSVINSGSDDGLYTIDRDGSHRRRLVAF